MSSVGLKMDKFGPPVCNVFQAIKRNDQLCYEVDLNRFSNKDNIRNEMRLGFVFFMDYNEDRQVTFYRKLAKDNIISSQFINTSATPEARIYINTIGKFALS